MDPANPFPSNAWLHLYQRTSRANWTLRADRRTPKIVPRRQLVSRNCTVPKSFLHIDRVQGRFVVRTHKLARARCSENRTLSLLTEGDLEHLAALLTESTSPTLTANMNDGADRVNFDRFCVVRNSMRFNAVPFLTATSFLQFRRDQWGRISAHIFFRHVCRSVALSQTRIRLDAYDSLGNGWLREQDVENYLYELIPVLPPLSGLQENFYPFYVFTAVRKIFFFLDPRRTGKVRIVDVLESPLLAELLELRDTGPLVSEPGSTSPRSDQAQGHSQSWFSAHSALRVYSQYLDLDVDHNGMLSETELGAYGLGSLTSVFVERVFQECHTYDGEMDYKTFLDFVLAMEYKKTPQALQYFWRLLDIKNEGFIDVFTINYFFREVACRLRQDQPHTEARAPPSEEHGTIRAEDVADEIFDMAKPANEAYITLADLLKCGVGDTIVTMLSDYNGFWQYDNRERLRETGT